MKVTIITVVYNNKNCIAQCIESVLQQTYPNIEHIVVDGGSTDGTVDIIKKYQDQLGGFHTGKDNGLYDALNKGIKMATGEVIGILHSDDLFYQPDTIVQIVKAFNKRKADLVYGNGMYVPHHNLAVIHRVYKARPNYKLSLNLGMIPLHTTIFVRKELFEKYGEYDDQYHIAGDYEISLRWFKNHAIKKYYLNEWVVKMRLGGKSTSMNQQRRKSKEDLEIIHRHGLWGGLTLLGKISYKIPQYLWPRLTRMKDQKMLELGR